MSKLLVAPGILGSPFADVRTGLLTPPWQRALTSVVPSPGVLGAPVVDAQGVAANAWTDIWDTLGASVGLLRTRMVERTGRLTPAWQHFLSVVEV